jgi:hypothetical protein
MPGEAAIALSNMAQRCGSGRTGPSRKVVATFRIKNGWLPELNANWRTYVTMRTSAKS